jgi:hypothetical protein
MRDERLPERVSELELNYDLLHDEFIKLSEIIDEWCVGNQNKIRIPHRCPVCNGTIFAEDGSFCIPCDGTGVVWG